MLLLLLFTTFSHQLQLQLNCINFNHVHSVGILLPSAEHVHMFNMQICSKSASNACLSNA